MPTWDVHNKWALRYGIANDVSSAVNLLVDSPGKCEEFLNYCRANPACGIVRRGRMTKATAANFTGHDSGRSHPGLRDVQLTFLRGKGADFVRAWYLHHLLDYLTWWVSNYEANLSAYDILTPKRIRKKIGDPGDPDLSAVAAFVARHFSEIHPSALRIQPHPDE